MFVMVFPGQSSVSSYGMEQADASDLVDVTLDAGSEVVRFPEGSVLRQSPSCPRRRLRVAPHPRNVFLRSPDTRPGPASACRPTVSPAAHQVVPLAGRAVGPSRGLARPPHVDHRGPRGSSKTSSHQTREGPLFPNSTCKWMDPSWRLVGHLCVCPVG